MNSTNQSLDESLVLAGAGEPILSPVEMRLGYTSRASWTEILLASGSLKLTIALDLEPAALIVSKLSCVF